MALSDGICGMFNIGNDNYPLAFCGSDTVKLNNSSTVSTILLCMANPSTSDWFGYGTNLKSDNRVIQRAGDQGLADDNLLRAIASPVSDQYL
ncbi:hypothetical protein RHS04_08511 [Rhizoctonia solani]|uniref:Uncharacterized protein n=1 Tax=Rhizoctonia solani TaxID=456999 RepID=A0A8H7LJ92_9AGAM|nr:hypothetical protein RHS04_08511 [Rhizoctonia solani]